MQRLDTTHATEGSVTLLCLSTAIRLLVAILVLSQFIASCMQCYFSFTISIHVASNYIMYVLPPAWPPTEASSVSLLLDTMLGLFTMRKAHEAIAQDRPYMLHYMDIGKRKRCGKKQTVVRKKV